MSAAFCERLASIPGSRQSRSRAKNISSLNCGAARDCRSVRGRSSAPRVIVIRSSDEPPLHDVSTAVEVESDSEECLPGDPPFDGRQELIQLADLLGRQHNDESSVKAILDPAEPVRLQLLEELQRVSQGGQLER